MHTLPDRQRSLEAIIATATRIARDGITETVEIPDFKTAERAAVQVDQAAARKLLAGLNDTYVSGIWLQIRNGQTLPRQDREALSLWTAATIAEMEDAERDRRAVVSERRPQLYLVKGDRP
jgi:hypothetical protein